MPTTQFKGLSVQTAGSNAGVWGVGSATALNEGVIGPLDSMIGGIVTKSLSSTAVNLTATESQNAMLRLTGTLTANVTVTTLNQGFFYCENATTGNFAITITNGVGTTVIIPIYTSRLIFADSTNGCRAVGLDPPGTLKPTAVPTAALHASFAGEYILGFGQSVATANYPGLFAIYGYFYGGAGASFNMPDLRGRSMFGLDNMGGAAAGRLTTAGSGIDGSTIGSSGGSQSTTLTTSQLPASPPGISSLSTAINNGTSIGQAPSGTLGVSSGGSFITLLNAVIVNITATTTLVMANLGLGQPTTLMNPAFVCNIMIKT